MYQAPFRALTLPTSVIDLADIEKATETVTFSNGQLLTMTLMGTARRSPSRAAIDQRGPGYFNDIADDWRRGGGKGGATGKPSFDRGNAWRMKDFNDWGAATTRQQSESPRRISHEPGLVLERRPAESGRA